MNILQYKITTISSIVIGLLLSFTLAGQAEENDLSIRPADISLETLQFGPHNRWAFSHLREMITTVNMPHDQKTSRNLVGTPLSPNHVTIKWDGLDQKLSDVLATQYNDGILVIKNGRVVIEGYSGALTQDKPHAMFSMTKSFVGSMAGILANDGIVDLNKTVKEYIPELASSGYGDETLQRLMDMRDGTAYTETYADLSSSVQLSDCAAGFYGGKACPQTYPDTVYDVLKTIGRDESNLNRFVYKSGSPDVVAWALEAATGKKLSALLAEYIWQPMGAEFDANITVDKGGFEYANGGMSATLRDMGRFGLLLLENGKRDGKTIVPESFIVDIMENKSETDWVNDILPSGASNYQSFFWKGISGEELFNPEDFNAQGIHGQIMYISPKEELVVVLFSSWPSALGNDKDHGFGESAAVIKALMSIF